MKRINTRDQFVEQTVKQIGYPRWDKIIKQLSRKTSHNRRSVDSGYIYFIPFVRDSAEVVNATMIISTTNTDTSINYLCDWQYKDTVTTGMSSRAQSLLLMNLDKNVFGERLYKITDTAAFGKDDNQNFIRFVRLASSDNSLVNNLMVSVTITYCYEHYYASENGQLVGCPPGPTCTDWIRGYKCENHIFWAFIEETGGNQGGGTSTGGSGGGTPGGGTNFPPNCGVVPVEPLVATRAVKPCDQGPGWTPVPVDEEPPSVLDILAVKLNLNSAEVFWLNNNPIFLDETHQFLLDAQANESRATNLPYHPSENPYALMAAKTALQTAMAGIIESGFNQSHFSILKANLPAPYDQSTYDPMYAFYFSMECINLKLEHPE
ncbi:MAG: hypothetical protein EOO07_32235, partial [Chitinophagaceae bacterium]